MAGLIPVSSNRVYTPPAQQTSAPAKKEPLQLPVTQAPVDLEADISARELERVCELNTGMAIRLACLLARADAQITEGSNSTAEAQASLVAFRNSLDHSHEARQAEDELSEFEEPMNESNLCFAAFREKYEQLNKQLADGKRADPHKSSTLLRNLISEVEGLSANIERRAQILSQKTSVMQQCIDEYNADLPLRGRIFKDTLSEIRSLGTPTGMITCRQIDKQYQITVTQSESLVVIRTDSFTTKNKAEGFSTIDWMGHPLERTKHTLEIQGTELLVEPKGSSPRKFTIVLQVFSDENTSYDAEEPKITWE